MQCLSMYAHECSMHCITSQLHVQHHNQHSSPRPNPVVGAVGKQPFEQDPRQTPDHWTQRNLELHKQGI